MRGEKVRKVKAHVKTEVLIGVVRGKSIVLKVNTGKAYSDECGLLMPILEGLKTKAKYFLADAYYSKIDVLLKVKQLKMKAIVPARNTIYTDVKHSIRVCAKENHEKYKKIYRKVRYRAKQVIGIVKNKFGDKDNVINFHVARLHVLARFVLYNLTLLFKLMFSTN